MIEHKLDLILHQLKYRDTFSPKELMEWQIAHPDYGKDKSMQKEVIEYFEELLIKREINTKLLEELHKEDDNDEE